MKPMISQYQKKMLTAVLNSPIEIFLSLLFFVLNMFLYFYPEFKNSSLQELSYYYFAFFAVTFAFNIIFIRRRIYYYLSAIFPVLIYLYLLAGYDYTVSLIITTISSVFLIFTSHNEKENIRFTGKAIVSTLNILISGILTLISALLLFSIIKSINYIFDINDNDNLISSMIQYVATYMILPLLFLVLSFRDADVVKIDRFSEVMVNYILTPALFIYGIILYGYFAKVIILWELPKGVISTTAISFLSIGVIVKACRELTNKKILEWFFKYIGYISIPALIMLCVGCFYRIWEYGFTENRIYLMITAIVLTVWNFAQMCNKTNIYQYLTIFTILAFNIALYIPNKYDTVKLESKEKKDKETFAIYSYSKADIDIAGYSKIIHVDHSANGSNYTLIKNDTLFFNTPTDSLITWVSTKSLIDTIFKNAGTSYAKLDKRVIENIESNPIIFKNDSIIIVIKSLKIRKEKDKITLDRIGIDEVIIR